VTLHPYTIQDVAAGVAANVVLLAVSTLAVVSVPIPDVLSAAAGASVTWLFVRSAQVARSGG